MVGVIQGGVGILINMNVNEVIINIVFEMVGCEKGDYVFFLLIDYINCSQLMNDVYLIVVKIGLFLMLCLLFEEFDLLCLLFFGKLCEFYDVFKVGCIQLQDVVLMMFGQEFNGFVMIFGYDYMCFIENVLLMFEINMGVMVIGMGIIMYFGYVFVVFKYLCEIMGFDLCMVGDFVEVISDIGLFMLFFLMFKCNVMKLLKICNDFWLLLFGLQVGFGEINFLVMQVGLSIMFGKVNLVILEVVNQVVFVVVGVDMIVMMVVEVGQLQLNVFELVIVYLIFQLIIWMCQVMWILCVNCVDGIIVNCDCFGVMVGVFVGVIIVLMLFIGYVVVVVFVKMVLFMNWSVVDFVVEVGLMLCDEVIKQLLLVCLFGLEIIIVVIFVVMFEDFIEI